MRLRLATLLTLALLSPALAAPGDAKQRCNNVQNEGTDLSLAEVIGAKGEKIHFQSDRELNCPGDDSCNMKQYLIPGDTVVASHSYNGFACVGYVSKKGVWNAWVPEAKLRKVPVSKADSWAGNWGNQLLITEGRDSVNVEGFAVYKHSIGEENGGEENICTHTGQISGSGHPKGNYLRIVATQDGSYRENPENSYDCVAELWNLRDYLVVRDNSHCGGANVRFNGIYTRTPPDADPWAGEWTDGQSTLVFSHGYEEYKVKGNSFWMGAPNPDGTQMVNTGEVRGAIRPKGNRATLIQNDLGEYSEKPKDEYSCVIKLERKGETLEVEDNLKCGGLNVTFTGTYKRKH